MFFLPNCIQYFVRPNNAQYLKDCSSTICSIKGCRHSKVPEQQHRLYTKYRSVEHKMLKSKKNMYTRALLSNMYNSVLLLQKH